MLIFFEIPRHIGLKFGKGVTCPFHPALNFFQGQWKAGDMVCMGCIVLVSIYISS